MTDALVEKISAELYRQYKAHPEWDDAKDVVESFDHKALACIVLDHFSEPGNVTKGMRSAAFMHGAENYWTDAGVISAAMRAARDEVSRDT